MLELITILTGSIGLAVILYLTGYMVEFGGKIRKTSDSFWNTNGGCWEPVETKPFYGSLYFMSLALPFIGGFLAIIGIITLLITLLFGLFEITAYQSFLIMLLGGSMIIYYLFFIGIGYITTRKNDYSHKIIYHNRSDDEVTEYCEIFDETSDFMYAIFKEDKCVHAIPKKNIIELYFEKSKEKKEIQKKKEKPPKKKEQN